MLIQCSTVLTLQNADTRLSQRFFKVTSTISKPTGSVISFPTRVQFVAYNGNNGDTDKSLKYCNLKT